MGKKKKSLSPAASTAGRDAGHGLETDVLLLAKPVEKCPAFCACFHWETLRKIGAVLGEAVVVSAISSEPESLDGRALVLNAWASSLVEPQRVALADDARVSLGPAPSGVRVYTLPRVTEEATRVELEALNSHPKNEKLSLGGQLDSAIRAQLLGSYVGTGYVIPVRLHGLPFTFRVLRVDGRGNDTLAPSATPIGRFARPLVPPLSTDSLPALATMAADGDACGSAVCGHHKGVAREAPLLVGTRTLLSVACARACDARPPACETASFKTGQDAAALHRGDAERTLLSDVAGMEETVRRVRQLVELPLRSPHLFKQVKPCRVRRTRQVSQIV